MASQVSWYDQIYKKHKNCCKFNKTFVLALVSYFCIGVFLVFHVSAALVRTPLQMWDHFVSASCYQIKRLTSISKSGNQQWANSQLFLKLTCWRWQIFYGTHRNHRIKQKLYFFFLLLMLKSNRRQSWVWFYVWKFLRVVVRSWWILYQISLIKV